MGDGLEFGGERAFLLRSSGETCVEIREVAGEAIPCFGERLQVIRVVREHESALACLDVSEVEEDGVDAGLELCGREFLVRGSSNSVKVAQREERVDDDEGEQRGNRELQGDLTG